MLVFLDTEAIPNLISTLLLSKVGLELTTTKRKIRVANAVNDGCKGFIKEVQVMFLQETVRMNFLVVDGVPVNFLSRVTALERL